MEIVDYAIIVISRIRRFEPENAMKISGYVLLKFSEKEIMKLAYSHDNQIIYLINEAKAYLTSLLKSNTPRPMQPLNQQFHHISSSSTVPRHISSPTIFHAAPPMFDPKLLSSHQMPEPIDSSKVCHYYNKGYCKNGSKCRFFHRPTFQDRFSNVHSPNLNEFGNEKCDVSPGSLAHLELEIIELLKSKSGAPISVDSLPTMYFEKYGKMLQVDGFLTGSQRLGKPECSLIQLLKRLNNSIQLIERSHGQYLGTHAEDASKYMHMDQRIDQGLVNAFSTEIYLTFPVDSTFTTEDVFKYFNQYGPVHYVRIPHQEKRMFGFVSFFNSETVKVLLAKGNSHYICGACVLVKPCKGKTILTDKIAVEMEPSQYLSMDKELDTMLNKYESSTYCSKPLLEYHDPLLLERGPLFQQKLSPNRETPQSYFSKFTEDDGKRQSAVLTSGLIGESTSKQDSNRNTDTDRLCFATMDVKTIDSKFTRFSSMTKQVRATTF